MTPSEPTTTGDPAVVAPTTIIVIGDLMVDRYVGGTVDRISPEAPVPVVRVVTEHQGLGGAANVARQVVALGATAHLLGVVGDDTPGRQLIEDCERLGIRHRIVVDRTRPTTTKERLTVGRQQIARIDRESTEPVAATTEDAVMAAFGDIIAAVASENVAVVISDYAKGLLSDRVLASVFGAAAGGAVPVLTDPKGRDFTRYRGSALLKANRAEFEAALGHSADDIAAVIGNEGARLAEAWGIGHLVVTLGADGMIVAPAGAAPTTITAAARDVYDVSGAGDTVIATLAVTLASGTPLLDAAHLANAAGGIAVQHRGVAVVSATELAAVAAQADAPTKVYGQGRLVDIVARWRANGDHIVFTNGCFDLFHAGHVHLLQQAARLGERLVVAVDDDASVAALKGSRRPIIAEAQRRSIIAALDCVDAVVPFHSSELEALIDSVGPDVLVKGSDYATEDVVGAAAVTARGGQVVLVPLLGDVSTTAVVGKIRDD